MHIGVFGLPGAGKTTLAKKITQKYASYTAISASKLIKDFGGVIDYMQLEQDNVRSNQEKLVAAYESFISNQKNSLIELHSVIESESGTVEVDLSVLRRLRLDIAFFIRISPDELSRRRRLDLAKLRRRVGPSELAMLQERAIQICQAALGNRLVVVDFDVALFEIERVVSIS